MIYIFIAAYVILAFASLAAEGKKQTFFSALGAALCSYMAFRSYYIEDAIMAMCIYFGVGLLFVLFSWALDKTIVTNQIKRPTAAILAILFGTVGAHKYYVGKNAGGIFYLLFSWTLIPLILGIAEGIYFLIMDDKAFYARYHVVTSKNTKKTTANSETAKKHPASNTQTPRSTPQTAPASKAQQSAPANTPKPSVVTAGVPNSNWHSSSISEAMEAKYSSVQTVLSDAIKKANAIKVFGEKEGAELAVIKQTLESLNADFAAEIAKLKNASEWDRFCIAFFGETNAGKSTIIESLRIIYEEESKRCEALEQRMEYYGLMKQHCEDYRDLVSSLGEVNAALQEHNGQKKNWRNYLIIGAVSLVVGFAVGLILAKLGMFGS